MNDQVGKQMDNSLEIGLTLVCCQHYACFVGSHNDVARNVWGSPEGVFDFDSPLAHT